jgi:two-component system, sensor histidine kinase and response regulator
MSKTTNREQFTDILVLLNETSEPMGTNLKNELFFEESSLTSNSLSILLVEDNPGDVVIIKELLRSAAVDFSLKHVSTLRETLLLCVEHDFDIVLMDLGLPDSIGLETLKKIQQFNLKSPVVVMTGLDDEDVALESLRVGAQDYLVKSRLTSDTLLRGIKYGIERKKIQDLLRKNARQFSILSATSTAINESEDASAIYTVACRNISALLDRAGVASVDLIDRRKIHSSGTSYIEPWNSKVKLMTGLSLNGPVPIFDFQNQPIIDLFNDGKIHLVKDESANPSGTGLITETTSSQVSGTINIYVIGFTKRDTAYGGAFIITSDIIGPDDSSIIETISSQVSLSLHRRAIEQDLKSSENRYRRLSEELEQKVMERTSDLKHLNYQLNQELIERHLAEEALKKSETSLRELNATKDKFFSIIAHDLKNPFTCLLGSTELLSERLDRMSTESIRELVQILNDSAKSGYAILQNLLDWSRSQTGMIRFNPERINLKEILDDNIFDLQLSSEKKEITVYSGLQEDLFIFADKNMLNTVLRNLLSNAVKFTHKSGTVSINVVFSGNEVTISVKDTGIGIPEQKIRELFRIDTKYTRPGTDMEQGTGLGLKICKEFVELQGGTIRVESKANEGSEFIFSIPSTDMTPKRG